MILYVSVLFFFFKQKTAYEMRISDWSSDVCSSDLRRVVVTFRTRTDACPGQHADQHRARQLWLRRVDAQQIVRAQIGFPEIVVRRHAQHGGVGDRKSVV